MLRDAPAERPGAMTMNDLHSVERMRRCIGKEAIDHHHSIVAILPAQIDAAFSGFCKIFRCLRYFARCRFLGLCIGLAYNFKLIALCPHLQRADLDLNIFPFYRKHFTDLRRIRFQANIRANYNFIYSDGRDFRDGKVCYEFFSFLFLSSRIARKLSFASSGFATASFASRTARSTN